jgi:hypothetical protein
VGWDGVGALDHMLSPHPGQPHYCCNPVQESLILLSLSAVGGAQAKTDWELRWNPQHVSCCEGNGAGNRQGPPNLPASRGRSVQVRKFQSLGVTHLPKCGSAACGKGSLVSYFPFALGSANHVASVTSRSCHLLT